MLTLHSYDCLISRLSVLLLLLLYYIHVKCKYVQYWYDNDVTQSRTQTAFTVVLFAIRKNWRNTVKRLE